MCRPKLTIQVPKVTFSNPCNFRIVGRPATGQLHTEKCGMDVRMEWDSADGNHMSLTKVHCNEIISEPLAWSGCFLGTRFHVSSSIEGHNGWSCDSHRFPAERALAGPGMIKLHQVFIYAHGNGWKAAPNSGFEITHVVEKIAEGRYMVTTTKTPAHVRIARYIQPGGSDIVQTNEPLISDAGVGHAGVIQVVERGGLKPELLIKAERLLS